MTGSDSERDVLENIKDKVQHILDRKFSSDSRIKRKIDVFHDRWNFACPCCGDSLGDNRKKRGNIYVNNLSFHCFNCGEHMGINTFLKRFDEELDNEDKIAVHEIQQSSKKFERRTGTAHTSMSMMLLEKLAVPKSIFFKSKELISPYRNETASEYLKSRKIDIRNWKYFAYSVKSRELYIMNISPDDRVIGYQIRQLDPNSRKARYLSRSLSKMYDEMFHKDLNQILKTVLMKVELGEKYINDEDGVENISANLDRLSGIFNIMNVDVARTLTVMEGPIDSLAIPNSVALQGASKQYNGFFDELPNVRYLFDNDKTGKEMSIRKLKDHKTVFLWGMYIQSISTREKMKDINDLQKKDIFNMDIIEKCFSNDEFDVMMI